MDPLRIHCHPAAFGQRWDSVVVTNARIQIVDNLCKLAELMEESEDEVTSSSNHTLLDNIFENHNDDGHSNVLLYIDAFEEPGEPHCDYGDMAEAAQEYFGNVTYLLVQAHEEMDFTEYMTLEEGEDDTELTLGMITFEDGQSIQDFPSLNVNIDGTSISILDVFDEEEVEEENEEMLLKMILTRIFSCFSIVGSGYIIFSLAGTRENRKKIRKSLFNRLLLGLSIADIISSISMFVGNWAMPKQPPGNPDEYVVSQAFWDALWPGAAGNDASCTAQGFFIHVGVLGSTFFTTFVAVQTLGLVKYNWTRIQMNKIEKVFYAVGIGHPLLTATAAAALGLFNPTNTGFCWINMNPVFCNEEERGPLVEEYCEGRVRAENWFLWHMLFSMSWVYIALVVIAFSMISLYLVVRKQEKRVSRSSMTASDSERQRKILIRGMLYISIYLLIWIPVSLNFLDSEDGEGGDDDEGDDEDDRRLLRWLEEDEGDDGDEGGDFDFFDIFEFLATIVLPAQGFLNALIYSGVLDKCVKKFCCCKCCESNVPVAGAASTHYFSSAASTKFSGASMRNSGASSRHLVAAGGSSDGFALSESFQRDANSTQMSTSLRTSGRVDMTGKVIVDAKSESEVKEESKQYTTIGGKSVSFDESAND